jgi:lysophospholipase L1-like esterase
MPPRFDPRKLAIPAALVVALIVYALWPSPFAKVKNLGSKGTSIIAFGDSLTAGYGAGPGEDYPSRLATLLPAAIANAGISGDTTSAALSRLDADVIANNPRIVIVGLGGNDFLRSEPIASTEANLRTIVRQIQASGAMVVLLGFRFPSLNASYESMYERVAKEEGCLLIPDLLDGILSNSSLKSDPIHPNGAGYQVMAERVAGPVKKLLKKADAAR